MINQLFVSSIILIGFYLFGGLLVGRTLAVSDYVLKSGDNMTGELHTPVGLVVGNETRNITFGNLDISPFGIFPTIKFNSPSEPLGNQGAFIGNLIIYSDDGAINPCTVYLSNGLGSAKMCFEGNQYFNFTSNGDYYFDHAIHSDEGFVGDGSQLYNVNASGVGDGSYNVTYHDLVYTGDFGAVNITTSDTVLLSGLVPNTNDVTDIGDVEHYFHDAYINGTIYGNPSNVTVDELRLVLDDVIANRTNWDSKYNASYLTSTYNSTIHSTVYNFTYANCTNGNILKNVSLTNGILTPYCVADQTGGGGSGANVTTTTCSGTNKVSAINNNTGVVTCSTDATGVYALQVAAANSATTTDAQVVYWGGMHGVAVTTTADNTRIYIPQTGTLSVAYVFVQCATAGTAENWNMTFYKNNAQSFLIQNIALSNTRRVWANLTMGVPVSQGDYFEILEREPTWATNPANCRRTGVIYIV